MSHSFHQTRGRRISHATPSTDVKRTAPLAVITGASGGLGLCIAQRLAKRGMRTLLIARSTEKLQQHAIALSEFAPSTAVTLDLADTTAIVPVMRELLEAHGPANVLINNAGYGLYKPTLALTRQERASLLDVNFTAAMEMICAVLPTMQQQQRGHIINIASIASKFGPWGHGVYAASKAALVALTQSLSIEYQQEGLHFSYVNPGLIHTDFFNEPAYQQLFERMRNRVISPELAADRIVTLLDRPKLELCIPRHYRFVDVLNAITPRLTRRIVSAQSKPPEAK